MLRCVLLTAAVGFFLGCDKPSPPAPSGTAPAAEAKAEPKPAKWEKSHTADCPTHLRSAIIAMENTEKGYAVTVTSKDAYRSYQPWFDWVVS